MKAPFNISGLEQWNDKILFRAMDSQALKEYKPQAWRYLKEDYLFGDDYLLPSLDELFNKDVSIPATESFWFINRSNQLPILYKNEPPCFDKYKLPIT